MVPVHGAAGNMARMPDATPDRSLDRELDLVVLGATGFTGRLTAEYLARIACDRMIVIPGNHDSRNVGYVHFEELFGELSGELTDDTLIGLNSRVDVDGEAPADVAADFLSEIGIT